MQNGQRGKPAEPERMQETNTYAKRDAQDDMARCNTQGNDMATTANNRKTPGTSVSEHYNLSSDDNLGDEALEMLIKSKQEAEIFNDLPLFDVDILNNFINELFDDQSISIDDLQLPVDISVTFHGAIANELALAQKIVELNGRVFNPNLLIRHKGSQRIFSSISS